MDSDRLNRWLSVASNLGVIVGIVFLAVEINQSNSIAEYSAENTRRALFAELNSNFLTSPKLAALGVKLQETSPVLSEQESVQAGFLVRRFFNAWANSEEAYRRGLLSEFSWQGTLIDIDATFAEFPGLALAYNRVAQFRPSADASGLEIIDRIEEHVARLR